MRTVHEVKFTSLLQVRPCRDAVRRLLGEQLLGHVALHPLRLLRLRLPAVPAHHLVLPAEGLWLRPRPRQVSQGLREADCWLLVFFKCASGAAGPRPSLPHGHLGLDSDSDSKKKFS